MGAGHQGLQPPASSSTRILSVDPKPWTCRRPQNVVEVTHIPVTPAAVIQVTCNTCRGHAGGDTQVYATAPPTGSRRKRSNSVQCSSVAQSCPTVSDPMNCSTPGLPVHHHLLEFTQTHLHRVGDAIQSSHPLSSPSPGDLPNPGIEPRSVTLWAVSLPAELTRR